VVLERDGDDQLDRKKNYIESRRREIFYKQKKEVRKEVRKEGSKEGRKANWNGHILRMNCPLGHIIKGNIQEGIEVAGR
jgi:hypothetical protein